MSSDQSGSADGRAGDPSRLQHGGGPVDWDSPAEEAAAEALDRRLADKDLIDRLRESGFEGHAYDYVATELARYGHGVLQSWIVRKTIFGKVARMGRAVDRPPFSDWPKDEAESLANEVVAQALTNFVEQVLAPDKWDPRKGASLATYFVGQCLLTFPNIYRKWLKSYAGDEPASDVLEDLPGSHLPAPDDDVIRSEMASAALSMVKSVDARKAFVMVSAGYSQREIAEILGKTEKAVERMIAYARKCLQKRDSA